MNIIEEFINNGLNNLNFLEGDDIFHFLEKTIPGVRKNTRKNITTDFLIEFDSVFDEVNNIEYYEITIKNNNEIFIYETVRDISASIPFLNVLILFFNVKDIELLQKFLSLSFEQLLLMNNYNKNNKELSNFEYYIQINFLLGNISKREELNMEKYKNILDKK